MDKRKEQEERKRKNEGIVRELKAQKQGAPTGGQTLDDYYRAIVTEISKEYNAISDLLVKERKERLDLDLSRAGWRTAAITLAIFNLTLLFLLVR